MVATITCILKTPVDGSEERDNLPIDEYEEFAKASYEYLPLRRIRFVSELLYQEAD